MEERTAADYAAEAWAPATNRAYAGDFAPFQSWGGDLKGYLVALANKGRKPSTIARAASGIRQTLKKGGLPTDSSPEIQAVLRGIRRLGAESEPAKPLFSWELRQWFSGLTDQPIDLRSKALLAITYAGVLRREEAVALNVEDVSGVPSGLDLQLRDGEIVSILYGKDSATCPVLLLLGWLRAAGITTGPIFRKVNRWGQVADCALNGRSVYNTVARCVKDLGLGRGYSTESLRRGACTEASLNGVDAVVIAKRARVLSAVRLIDKAAGIRAARAVGL